MTNNIPIICKCGSLHIIIWDIKGKIVIYKCIKCGKIYEFER